MRNPQIQDKRRALTLTKPKAKGANVLSDGIRQEVVRSNTGVTVKLVRRRLT